MKNATFEDKLVTHNYKVKAWREEEKAGGDKKGENPKRFLLTSFPLGCWVGRVVGG